MILHNNKKEFRILIAKTASTLGIEEFYVEKDYWVTYILKQLSNSEHLENVVFKGGTSLSKAHKVIARFSEDIDLQLIKNTNYLNMSQAERKNYLKSIELSLTKELSYLNKHPRETKNSNIRKTIYGFNPVTPHLNAGQVIDVMILEINTMSIPEPYKKIKIKSYIAEFLEKNNLSDVIVEYELETIEVNVLALERTFVEKIFAILDFSMAENPVSELANKIRHLYDVYKLFHVKEIKDFFESDEFYKVSNRVVVENDFFGNRKDYIYRNSCLYKNLDILDGIRGTYNGAFKPLVFEELPHFEEIKNVIRLILEKIKIWEENYRK